jgi:hypothetical protein
MIFQIIQYSIVSLVIISVFHYLISHLTDNLTTPHVRDLVSSTNENYENIIKKIEKSAAANKKASTDSMKQDLKTYLNTINNSQSNTNSQSQSNASSNINNINNYTYYNSYDFESAGNSDELAYSTY